MIWSMKCQSKTPIYNFALFGKKDVKTQTWTMIASIQGNPVLASLQASKSLSSSFQGIYKLQQINFKTTYIMIKKYMFAFNKGLSIKNNQIVIVDNYYKDISM